MKKMHRISVFFILCLFLCSTISTTYAYPVGDMDGNWKVNLDDLRISAEQWMSLPDCLGAPGCADLIGNDDVDFMDFALLAENWLLEETPPLVINEVMASNDATIADEHGDYDDWFEIYNHGSETIDIGGMYVKDSSNSWQIPAGVTIKSGQHLIFWADNEETQGNFHTNFKLGAGGDQIGIYLTDDDTSVINSISFGQQLTDKSYGRYPDASNNWYTMDETHTSPGGENLSGGYSITEDFGASANSVTFGRHTKSAASGYNVDFVSMAGVTKQTPNSAPLVPSVVINEIMYNSFATQDQLGEFIELKNRSASPVTLYDPANPSNTWMFTKGIDFTFPTGITISAGEHILIVRTTPDIFRTNHSLPPTIQILGPFENNTELQNTGEKIELSMPGTPEPGGFVPYICAEQVNYSDGSHPTVTDPWPTDADGRGDSLNRINASLYGNDVANWQSSSQTPGSAN